MRLYDLFEFADKDNATRDTLYCSRTLENGEDLVAWAKENGFKTSLEATDMHVTIAYSKAKVDWDKIEEEKDKVIVPKDKGERKIKQFDGGAIVLTFENEELEDRWLEFKDDFGASWDYPDYHPHVTISYDAGEDVDLDALEPFQGKLVFGPEHFAPLDTNWKDKIKHEKLNNDD